MRSGELPASCTHQIKPCDGGHQCDGVCLHSMCLKEFRRRVSVCVVVCVWGHWSVKNHREGKTQGILYLFVCEIFICHSDVEEWGCQSPLRSQECRQAGSMAWTNLPWIIAGISLLGMPTPLSTFSVCVCECECELQCVSFALREKVKSFRTSTFPKKLDRYVRPQINYSFSY